MSASPRRFALLVCILLGLLAVPLVSAAAQGGRGRAVAAPPSMPDGGAYMLRAVGRPAAAEYEAARRGGASRAEAARAARTRRQANARAHDEIVAGLTTRGLARRVLYRLASAYNGVAVHARRSEVASLRAISGVQDVVPIPRQELDNATGVPWIGAPAVWEGVPGQTGEGISIGIIDTGVDYVHTDFGGSGDSADLEAARDEAANPPGAAPPSFSVSGPGGQQLYPSAKVVGGYDFAGDGYSARATVPVPDPNPMDCGGHGSHVAGTAAGLGVQADGSTYAGPYDSTTPFGSLRIGPGVAPQADIYALRVFGCSGGTDLVPQALDWALDPDGNGDPSDHIDVLNLSIGSAYGSPDDLQGLIVDQVTGFGVIVVGTSGNSGDATYITGGPGAAHQAISVAASNTDAVGVAPTALEVTAPASVAGLYPAAESELFSWCCFTPVSGELVRPSDAVGCDGFNADDSALIKGAIPILDLFPDGVSPCNSRQRADNVAAAGGVGMILIDRPHAFFSAKFNGNQSTPTLMIHAGAAEVLLDALAGAPVHVRISREHLNEVWVRDAAWGDMIGSFSSRGPASTGGGLKPDITAPGGAVVSAAALSGDGLSIKAGTSMAAPHVAGAMALLRATHPSWDVPDLKALAMNTAADDLRFTVGGSEILSPARQGAGRIDLAKAVAGEVIAYDAGAHGQVGVSFGALEVFDTLVERTVRVVDKGRSGGTFDVGYVPATEVPGVGYSFPDGPTVTVPPGGQQTFRVRLSADAALMDGTADPNHTPAPAGSARDALAEASGSITLTPAAGSALRLPVYASLRPLSDMRAVEPLLAFNAAQDSTELHLAGHPVDSGDELPRDLVSLVTPFELQGDSPPLTGVDEIDRPADLRWLGVASDARRRLAAGEDFGLSRVWFGLTTWRPWSSPMTVDLVVQVDADLDGTYERELRNAMGGPDVFYTGMLHQDFLDFGLLEEDALNVLYPDVANTAVFDTNMLVLSGFAVDLGLVPGERFRYRVQTYSRFAADMIDSAGPFTYDPSAPGLDINGTGIAGGLMTRDLPGETLDVAFDQTAYDEDGGLGALLLHHYNTMGTRVEILQPVMDAAAPTSASTYPAAGADIPAGSFAGGCGTPVDDVCGTASDGVGGTGVVKVEVQLQRASDGLYYDGSGWVAAATWIEADGTTQWTRAFPAAPGDYTIATRATDLAGNVTTLGTPRAFRILPMIAAAGVLYTGDQSVVQGSTVTLRATLSSSGPLVCAPGGKTLSFSLDDDPTTAAVGDGPYALGTATTNGSGVATTTRSTSGWISGAYTVRVSLAAGDGCTAATDEATLTIAAAGDAASGGGWYTLAGAGRVNFGFTVHKVPGTSTYKGQVLLINNGKWRYKGTLTKYVKPTATSGSADATGTLYRWDLTTATWLPHATNVSLNIRFTDNAKQKKVADLFGARIAATGPLALPNSDPVAIKGGDVKVS